MITACLLTMSFILAGEESVNLFGRILESTSQRVVLKVNTRLKNYTIPFPLLIPNLLKDWQGKQRNFHLDFFENMLDQIINSCDLFPVHPFRALFLRK